MEGTGPRTRQTGRGALDRAPQGWAGIAPTPYPEVNALLAELRSGIRAALGERLVGLYLYGSLALEDFRPGLSDIDFLAAVQVELSPAELAALQELHQRLFTSGQPYAAELEGSYIPLAELRRYTPGRTRHPHIDRGSPRLALEQHDTDWVVQRWVTREHGVILAGPPPAALIDPISPEELRAAVRELFDFWWAPMAAEPERLQPPGYQVYAVLTMPRILYTFAAGAVISKPRAVAWALETLAPRWRGLLCAALAWKDGQPFDHLADTRALIGYVAARAEAQEKS